MTETLAQRLVATLRAMVQAYAKGDQVAPSAVLWTDPARLWESVVPELQAMLPELFLLGDYAAEKRTGPALWLRCIEARLIEGAPPTGTTPIFYLPGISRERLRSAEECPPELAALVELQYRGVVWLHVNGKEWTPSAFLVSKHGGLELDVAKDQATQEALAGALPTLMSEPLSHLWGRRLDSEFFNGLVAPDATGLMLRWLSDPDGFRQSRSDAEWAAFCQQGKADFHLDPVKDGPLKAARLLASRGNSWDKAWKRYAEAPAAYPGVVGWLEKAAPPAPTLFDTAEFWPCINAGEERNLRQELQKLVDRQQDEVIRRVTELEEQHGARRGYPWQKLHLSPMATVLEPLARLAGLCGTNPGAPTPEAFAEYYVETGWRVDEAALATMIECGRLESQDPMLGVLQAIYLPWLEGTARHLQKLISGSGQSVSKREKPIKASPGQVVLFIDGLRMDLARMLAGRLEHSGVEVVQGWEWSTIPSVTASGKPAISPIAPLIKGGKADDQFGTRLISTDQPLTPDRFVAALKTLGWQRLSINETGDPSGPAWTEAGAIDKRGHAEGWKLARSIEVELRDLVGRVRSLLEAGWTEIIVVTDHGWLLAPKGLPKVELKAFLVEHRWGRCAALKAQTKTDVAAFKWSWNESVMMASPPGVGCYKAGVEYSHGGISLQEMVTPVLRLRVTQAAAGSARLLEAKWTGAKCRVVVDGDVAGMRVDIRTSQGDPGTSLLSDGHARELPSDGRVTIFLEDDAKIGGQAEVILLDPAGQVIHSMPTTLGE